MFINSYAIVSQGFNGTSPVIIRREGRIFIELRLHNSRVYVSTSLLGQLGTPQPQRTGCDAAQCCWGQGQGQGEDSREHLSRRRPN